MQVYGNEYLFNIPADGREWANLGRRAEGVGVFAQGHAVTMRLRRANTRRRGRSTPARGFNCVPQVRSSGGLERIEPLESIPVAVTGESAECVLTSVVSASSTLPDR